MTDSKAPIIVPLDGSKTAENALPHAARLASLFGDCPVHLLHVVESDIAKDADDFESAKSAFEPYAAHQAQEHGIKNVVSHVAVGGAAESILRYQMEMSARLTIIATHGRGGFHATFIGSVADKVCRASTSPVLAIPGREATPLPGTGPAIIALDGSPEAEVGLDLGREIAQLLGQEVYLLRAYSIPPPVGVEFSYYSADVLSSFEAAAKEYLDEIAQPGEKKLVVQGAPAVAIEEAAKQFNAGFLVLTSRGKGLAHRLTLGSTTDRVLHAVTCPLLIVPIGHDD